MPVLFSKRLPNPIEILERRPSRRGVFRLAMAVTAGMAGAVAGPVFGGDNNNVFVYTGPGGTAASPVSGNFSNPASFSPAASNTGTTFGDLNTELQFGGNSTYDASNDIGPFALNEIQFSGTTGGNITVDGSSSNNPFNFSSGNQGSSTLTPQILQNGSTPITISAPINVAAPASNSAGMYLTVGGTGTGAINLAGNLTFGAYVTPTINQANAAGLIVSNPGTTNITGNLNFSAANVFSGGATVLVPFTGGIEATAGTLNFTGNSSISLVPTVTSIGTVTTNTAPNFEIGGPTGQAVVNVNTTGTLTVETPDVGGVFAPVASNPTTKAAVGVINQSSGTVIYTLPGTVLSNYLSIGAGNTTATGVGGYGAYLLNGGVLTANGTAGGGGIRVGPQGLGVLVQTGGVIATARYFSIGTYGTGVATFVSGMFNQSSAFSSVIGETAGNATFNLGTLAGGNETFSNPTTSVTSGGGVGFYIGNSTAVGVVNLDSGLINLGGGIGKGTSTAAGAATLNLNGATIQANGSGYALINSSSSYPLVPNVYHNGITIDSQTNTTTISANLSGANSTGLDPTGGFLSFPLGSGYLAPPLVTITDTSRTIAATAAASAIANVATGSITGITFTNPGMGYIAGDVLKLTFTGGQAGTSAAYYSLTSTYTVVGTGTDLISNSGGGLTKVGAGTLNLTGTNTYTGTTNISAGVLQPSFEGSLPGFNVLGQVAVQTGATLSLTVNTSAPAFTAADITTVGTDVTFANGSLLGINTANVAAGFNVATGGISGGEGLNKLGANTLTLGGTDTYTGPTQVTTGTLQVNSSSAISSTSQINVSNGASFAVNNTTAGLNTGGSPITLNITGNGVGNNGALVGSATGTATYAGNINLYTTSNTSGASIGGGANGTLIVSGTISGSGNLLFAGNSADNATGSTVILSAVNNYSGETQINGASNASGTTTVRLGTNNALSANSDIRFLGTNSGTVTLDLAGYNQSTSYLVGTSTSAKISNSLAGSTSTLTITNGNGSLSSVPIVNGNGTVAVALTGGTQTLGGTSTYSGGTTVSNGAVLSAGSGTAFGSGPVTLSGGTLFLAGTVTGNQVLSGFNGFSLNSFNTSTAPFFNSTTTATSVTLTDQATTHLTNGEGSSTYSPLTSVNTNIGFTANFTYTPSANVPAGGVAFVLQNDPRGATALGSPGGGLGYSFDTINYTKTATAYNTLNSVAVELNDASLYGTGTALVINGLYNTTFQSTSPVNIALGDPIAISLTYSANAGTVTEVLTDSGPSATATKTVVFTGVNYSNAIGGSSAYVGFTAGVGGGLNNQVISNFTLTNLANGPLSIANPIVAAAGTTSTLQTGTAHGYVTLGVGAVTINSGATLNLALASSTTPVAVVSTPSVNFTASAAGRPTSGILNLGNNDLDVTGQSLAAVTAEVASAYYLSGGGNWQGPGISSTNAASDTTHLTALGVIQNNQSGAAIYTAANMFDESTPGIGDVLVKYTYLGDANLDGRVDGSDYSLIDAGYGGHGSLTGWYYGDFNYDGVVDGSDYALIDNTFNNQNASLASTSALVATSTDLIAGPTAAVPEPAALGLAATVVALIGRRRRH